MKRTCEKFPTRYRKSSAKSSGGRGLFFQPIWGGGGGLIETRDGGFIWEGALFNLEMTMVSVHHKELKYKVEKLKNKKVGGHATEEQNQIRNSSW